MEKVKCELCPIQDHCIPRKEQEKLNDASYLHQEVVRVDVEKCPLMKALA